MNRRTFVQLRTGTFAGLAVLLSLAGGIATQASPPPGDDTPTLRPGAAPPLLDEEDEAELLERDLFFTSRRLAGDVPLDSVQAGVLRAAAAKSAAHLRKQGLPTLGPASFTGSWTAQGPNPIVQVTRSTPIFAAMSGRIGALAIRPSDGQFILGAAQGGIWLYDPATGTWTPKTDNLPSLAIGALAIAPSDDDIIYAGTGEGALSGDSYFGNGVLKSTDGGQTWSHVSGNYFYGVATARLVVDPTNANHVYAAVLRGRGGARRTSPPLHSRWGIWESTDGAHTWTLRKEAKNEANGATDLEIDPQNPNILYASFWQDAIYKSTNGGASWFKIMNGIPAPGGSGLSATRYSIAISHPAGQDAVLYAGFPSLHADGDSPSTVWKSTNQGASWFELPTGEGDDSVEDYCGEQCAYDNVIEADPINPDVVYAAGQFNYDIGSGGIFRSDDGGQTWKNLGWDQHPDFHALAMDPANPAHVLVGNDGGVRYSADRGGRPNASDPLSAVTWENLDGTVDPDTAAVTHRTGLQISQFTSIANVPTVPARIWGGTQDNGTIRKSSASQSWFDVASGDGGQVLVDPTDASFVYGTYFGITPYRFTDGGLFFFSNQYIRNGINLNDRAEFYIPWTMTPANPNQLFLGTYRVYRTDNAKVPAAGDVHWTPISGDLTSGCAGPASNGGRGCYVSAIGVGGGEAAYAGTEEGWVQLSKNAQTADHPTWARVGIGHLPNRPVTSIAVDRSNYRIAYVSYAGFNPATPGTPGHVFRTRDGGQTWTDISGNLPDTPVNSITLDPSFANTLYAATDVGTFVTYDGGATWGALGSGLPAVAVWQMDLDPSHRVLAAGTHGRGAWRLTDTNAVPALVLSKIDAGVPVGPSSNLDYTITLSNIGNAPATGVTITDPLPANTSFVSADSGGVLNAGKVVWTGLTVPAGGSTSVHLTVSVAPALKNKSKSIVNDGVTATSAEGPSTTGSPRVTPIAPPYAVSMAPAAATDGARAGESVDYALTLTNRGYNTDSYGVTAVGAYPAAVLDASCTSPLTTTGSIAPGGSAAVCVRVSVPGGAADGDTSTTTVTATSAGSPTVSATSSLRTIAVTKDTLVVDQDGNAPDVQSYYTAALTAAGIPFSVWDLAVDANLPAGYLNAHTHVVWFTGNTYPGPLLPYESRLAAFLDAGGRLFVSGQDILDQAAGTTSFVHDYLHIDWDGTEAQNDKATTAVHGVSGSPVTDGIGAVPLDHSVLGATFEDEVTPIAPALPAFTDDSAAPDALSLDTGTYKVVFLGFPMEAYGGASERAALIVRAFAFLS